MLFLKSGSGNVRGGDLGTQCALNLIWVTRLNLCSSLRREVPLGSSLSKLVELNSSDKTVISNWLNCTRCLWYKYCLWYKSTIASQCYCHFKLMGMSFYTCTALFVVHFIFQWSLFDLHLIAIIEGRETWTVFPIQCLKHLYNFKHRRHSILLLACAHMNSLKTNPSGNV